MVDVDELEDELDDEPVELDPFQLFGCGHQERTGYTAEEAKQERCYKCTLELESENDREYTRLIRDSGKDIAAEYKKAMLPANDFVIVGTGNRHDFFSAGVMEMPSGGINQRPLLLESRPGGKMVDTKELPDIFKEVAERVNDIEDPKEHAAALMTEAHRLYLAGYTGAEIKQPLQQELETLLAEEEADKKQQRIEQDRAGEKEQTDTLTGHGWFGKNVSSDYAPSLIDPTYTESELIGRNSRARRQQRIAEIREELERQEMAQLVQEERAKLKRERLDKLH